MQAVIPSLQLIHAVSNLSTDTLQQLRNQHEFYEAAFVTNGEGFFRVNDLSISISRGTVLLVPPNLIHTFYSAAFSDLEYSVIAFTVGDSHFLAEERNRNTASVTDGSGYINFINASFQNIIALWSETDTASKNTSTAFAASLLYLLQVLFLRSSVPILSNIYEDATTPFVHQIYHYIADHCQEKLTLQTIAQHFNISSSTLSHTFSQAFGVSPIDHMLHARVIKSTWYLVRTNMTLDEIAEKVGYSTTSLYLRQFRDRIGCKPTELRRKRKQNVAYFEPGSNPTYNG